MAQHDLYGDRIVVDPNILVGKPVVKGTRVPVAQVLQYLSRDLDVSEVMEAFPRVTREDIKACLAYAQKLVEGEAIYPVELPGASPDTP